MTARVLVIEDERDLAEGLRDNLQMEGYDAEAVHSGDEGLAALTGRTPDLLILDLMLPDTDGFRVLRQLRHDGHRLPVLLLTARGEEADKVCGFRLGADDYVTKPFGLLELLARVEALLRRAGAADSERVFLLGETKVDLAARTAVRAGQTLDLTPKEFDLLATLFQHDGIAVSRQVLLRDVWGHRGVVATRTVDTHVAELRRKIEPDPNHPRYIRTVRKHGYRLTL